MRRKVFEKKLFQAQKVRWGASHTHTHTRNNSRSWFYICSTVNLATPTTSFTSNCSCKSQLHCEQVFVKIPVQILTLLPKTEFWTKTILNSHPRLFCNLPTCPYLPAVYSNYGEEKDKLKGHSNFCPKHLPRYGLPWYSK